MGFLSKTYDRYRTNKPRLEDESEFYMYRTPMLNVQNVINYHLNILDLTIRPDKNLCDLIVEGSLIEYCFWGMSIRFAFESPEQCTEANILDFIIKHLNQNVNVYPLLDTLIPRLTSVMVDYYQNKK